MASFQEIIVYILLAAAIVFLWKKYFGKKKGDKNCGDGDCGCN